jgi:hypothetical protein
MNGIGDLVSKAQAFAAAVASAPSATDTPFVKNARPFVLWAGMPGLISIGLLATYMKLDALAGSAVVTIGAVMRELARFRSQDNQAATTAATENTKTITAASSTDQRTAAGAAPTTGEQP